MGLSDFRLKISSWACLLWKDQSLTFLSFCVGVYIVNKFIMSENCEQKFWHGGQSYLINNLYKLRIIMDLE